MAVSQCSLIIWSATGGYRRRGAATLALGRDHPKKWMENETMANQPTARITKEMQQMIAQMIARMSLRG